MRSHWQCNDDDPEISVCVITYNHARFIGKCLDGIRQQENLPRHEVIICDDASGDETENLIKEYIERYALTNYYYFKSEKNTGMMANLTKALTLCRGKFVALCEGDDYWTDPCKLQKQYSLMESNPECTITVHSGFILFPDGSRKKAFSRGSKIRRFDLREILSGSSTQFAPTASYFIRRKVLENLPDWFSSAPIGDLFLEILSLRRGYGLYLPERMSVYRVFSSGSWSNEMRNSPERSIDYSHRMLALVSILEADQFIIVNGLDALRANLQVLIACGSLLCKDFEMFRDYIERAFVLKSHSHSKTAKILYAIRRFPAFAAWAYRIKCDFFT